jgi:hypothetical protein
LLGTEQAIGDEAFTSHIISNLPPEFNNFVDIVLPQTGGYTVDELIAKVLEVEATTNQRSNEMFNANAAATAGVALTHRVDTRDGGFWKRGRGGYRRYFGSERWNYTRYWDTSRNHDEKHSYHTIQQNSC